MLGQVLSTPADVTIALNVLSYTLANFTDMPDMYQISTVRMCGYLVLIVVQLCPLVREHSGTASRVWYWRSHRSLWPNGLRIITDAQLGCDLSVLFCSVSLQFILETFYSVPSHYHECALRHMSRLGPAPGARSSEPTPSSQNVLMKYPVLEKKNGICKGYLWGKQRWRTSFFTESQHPVCVVFEQFDWAPWAYNSM